MNDIDRKIYEDRLAVALKQREETVASLESAKLLKPTDPDAIVSVKLHMASRKKNLPILDEKIARLQAILGVSTVVKPIQDQQMVEPPAAEPSTPHKRKRGDA